MQRLGQLLDAVVDDTVFDIGRAEGVATGSSRSFALRSGEVIPRSQWRELLGSPSWYDEDSTVARSAKMHLPDDLFSELNTHVHTVFRDYIDPCTDHIGHFFPIGGPESHESDRIEKNGDHIIEAVSPVETFAKALVRGAAALGTERVTSLISDWIQGKPGRYSTKAILNGDRVLTRSLSPKDGVRIESLPLDTDQLIDYLPLANTKGMKLEDFLGCMVLTVDCLATPALFRPTPRGEFWDYQITVVPAGRVSDVCQALSLESDTHMDTAFFWDDFNELKAFLLSWRAGTWSSPRARFCGPSNSLYFSKRIEFKKGVTSLRPTGDSTLRIDEGRLGSTLAALSTADPAVRVATSRWIRSKDTSFAPTDRFIDLRIALESLYLKDFANELSQEMRFRLALFGAWHLGADTAAKGGLSEGSSVRPTMQLQGRYIAGTWPSLQRTKGCSQTPRVSVVREFSSCLRKENRVTGAISSWEPKTNLPCPREEDWFVSHHQP